MKNAIGSTVSVAIIETQQKLSREYDFSVCAGR